MRYRLTTYKDGHETDWFFISYKKYLFWKEDTYHYRTEEKVEERLAELRLNHYKRKYTHKYIK